MARAAPEHKMTRTDPVSTLSLSLLDAIVARHGLRRVALALLAAALRGDGTRRTKARLDMLDDHLRRDVGLPPRGASPPMPDWVRNMW